jgi:hypothetical protein
LLSVNEFNRKCTMTNHHRFWKKFMIVTGHDVYLLFTWRYVDWQVGSKVCILCSYSQ